MVNFSKIRVFDAFVPFLRLLTAYNRDNFIGGNWRSNLRSVLWTFGVTVIMSMLFTCIVLIAWYLLENKVNLIKFSVAIPILATASQLELTFFAMLLKNHTITETIDQLQKVVDQRE